MRPNEPNPRPNCRLWRSDVLTKGVGFALLGFLLLGSIRLYWCARPGSEELAGSLHTLASATVGSLINLRTPAESYPREQYEFWVAEIDRILEANPKDAELHAAAALMLHEPCSLYISDFTKQIADQNRGNRLAFASNIFEQLRELRVEFDKQGSKRSIELIHRATDLAPDDPRWWRLRAILLWPGSLSSLNSDPLDENWEQVLQEASIHDPGNALYDVLQAHRISYSAFDYDDADDLVIVDQSVWDHTLQLAQRCVGAEKMILDEPGLNGLVRLHQLSQHPTATTIDSIRARLTAIRSGESAAVLARNLLWMSEVKELAKDDQQRKALLSLADRVVRLARERSGSATRHQGIVVQSPTMVLNAMARREEELGEVSESTSTSLERARQREDAFGRAANQFNPQTSNQQRTSLAVASAIALPLFAGTIGSSLMLVLLWCLFVRSRPDRLHCLWPSFLFLLGIGLSVLFLGAGPAELVSETWQHWILTGLSLTLGTMLLAGIAIRTGIRFRYSLRSLLIACIVAAVGLQTLFHFQIGWQSVGLPIIIHARRDAVLEMVQPQGAQALEQWLPGPTWVSDLVLRWLMHQGPVWSVAIFLACAMIILLWSKRIGQAWGQLTITTCLLATLWLNAWVWLEPSNYVSARPQQMRYETYIRSIDEYYQPFEILLERELETEQQTSGAAVIDSSLE